MEATTSGYNGLWEPAQLSCAVQDRSGRFTGGEPPVWPVRECDVPAPEPPPCPPAAPVPLCAPAQRPKLWENVGAHCFGARDSQTVAMIRELLLGEEHELLLYRHLADTCRKKLTGRLFRKLQERQHRLVRRLCTVYYLLSGQRYLAQREDCGVGQPETLRDRYHAEARAAAGYRQLAQNAADGCLKSFFVETAREKDEAAHQLMLEIEASLE